MTLTLYHTLGCHLCELAEAVIQQVKDEDDRWANLVILKTDIAEDDQLIEQYGIRIPVCKLENLNATLDWPFDSTKLVHFLNS